jgi:tRNA 2-thiouridine synthesizing protein B
MLLHIVNQSPFERDALASCLRHAKTGAGVLLIEDGVYAAATGSVHTAMVEHALARVAIYALTPDLAARGLTQRVIAGVKLVDYAGFVDLVTQHRATQSWS